MRNIRQGIVFINLSLTETVLLFIFFQKLTAIFLVVGENFPQYNICDKKRQKCFLFMHSTYSSRKILGTKEIQCVQMQYMPILM
jgi:hypothetical protein